MYFLFALTTTTNATDTLDPLLAAAHFLIAGQPSTIDLQKWNNYTIIKLYQLAMRASPQDLKSEGNRIAAFWKVVNTVGKQFQKQLTTSLAVQRSQ